MRIGVLFIVLNFKIGDTFIKYFRKKTVLKLLFGDYHQDHVINKSSQNKYDPSLQYQSI